VSTVGKKRKLRKLMRKRKLENETALVICVGKDCCARRKSRALLEASRAYAEETHAQVRVVPAACLHICKNGPIAATYPRIKLKKHVTKKRMRKLVDKLDRRHG
jgi:(2Fe-2S) ferredoxin